MVSKRRKFDFCSFSPKATGIEVFKLERKNHILTMA